ncbi:hypothetical protein [Lichenicoccus sp.]|uniref:hypothetical protein n=1 Tax=Lichenicoccus sp. TaxID=2781899 RepID=UPI003D09891A
MLPRLAPFDFALLVGAALAAFLMLGPALTIPLHIPINYNEGWDAGFATRAVRPDAGPLYPGPGSLVFDNYPPLGFLIVGAAGRFVLGDMIVAGRVLALLALLASAALLGLCVRQLGGSVRAAWAAALLLPLFIGIYFSGYVAMDDPQWLAHAFMLAGLAMLLRHHALRRLRQRTIPSPQIVLAAALMVAGGFVKHNLVALPLATTLWLAWLNPRAALAWMLAAAACIALALAAMQLCYGHAAFVDIFQHRRIIQPHLWTRAIDSLAPLAPTGIVIALRLRRRSAGDGAVLAALFILVALATGIAGRMGEGIYYNAHFEAVIALCLGLGLALEPAIAAARPAWPPARTVTLLVFAALPILGALPWHLPVVWRNIVERRAREAAWQPIIARLRAADGQTGCLMASLCYWAGKPIDIDMFNLTQYALTGGSLAGFKAMVARGGFVLFQNDSRSFTHADAVQKLGFDPVMAPFAGRYRIVLTGPKGTVLLAPTPPAIRPVSQ